MKTKNSKDTAKKIEVTMNCFIETEEFKRSLLQANARLSSYNRGFEISLHLVPDSFGGHYNLLLKKGNCAVRTTSPDKLNILEEFASGYYFGSNSASVERVIEIRNLPWYKRLFQQF